MHYGLVIGFGGAGRRVQGRADRNILSRRQLLRRSGDAGVGALVSAAVLSFHSQDVTTASDNSRAAASAAGPDGRAPVFVDARDHGAVGDGKTDDTAALQAALDSVGAGGGTVLI